MVSVAKKTNISVLSTLAQEVKITFTLKMSCDNILSYEFEELEYSTI